MRRPISLILFIVGVVLIAAGGVVYLLHPNAASCATETEIAVDERAAIEQASLDFVHDMLGDGKTDAFAALTADARKNAPQDQFGKMVAQIRPLAPMQNLRVSHIRLIRHAGGQDNAKMPCDGIDKADGLDIVTVKAVPKQAYAFVEGETKGNAFAFVLWLIPEPDWLVQYVHFTPTNMAGKTARDMAELARQQKNAKHNFNAALLFAASGQLAFRGPNYQLGLLETLHKDMTSFELPPELQGQTPYSWRLNNDPYKILAIGPIAVGGKMFVILDQEIAPWTDDKVAEKANRALLTDFAAKFPEYRDSFAGLVARAHQQGNLRIWVTVQDDVPEAAKPDAAKADAAKPDAKPDTKPPAK